MLKDWLTHPDLKHIKALEENLRKVSLRLQLAIGEDSLLALSRGPSDHIKYFFLKADVLRQRAAKLAGKAQDHIAQTLNGRAYKLLLVREDEDEEHGKSHTAFKSMFQHDPRVCK